MTDDSLEFPAERVGEGALELRAPRSGLRSSRKLLLVGTRLGNVESKQGNASAKDALKQCRWVFARERVEGGQGTLGCVQTRGRESGKDLGVDVGATQNGADLQQPGNYKVTKQFDPRTQAF